MIYSYYNENPKPLEEDEFIELFQKYQVGDKNSYEQLIIHNLNLISFIIKNKFSNYQVDREELFSIGEIGLMKAIQTFDLSKKRKFSSYAVKCITNEILKFIRKNKNNLINVSLNAPIFINDGKELTYEESFADSTVNIEEDFFYKERLKYIKEIVDAIPNSRDKEIIKLAFGFEQEPMNQYEIARKFNLSQAYISRIIKKNLIYISRKLKKMEEQDLQIVSLQETKENFGPTISEILDCSKKEFLNLFPKLTCYEQRKLKFLFKIDFNCYVKKFNGNPELKENLDKLKNRIKELKEEGKKMELKENIENIKKTKIREKKRGSRVIHSIYWLLKEYTKEEIDAAIATLDEEDKKLLWLRYGDDLENPKENPEWKDEYMYAFYNKLIPKLKRRLIKAREMKKASEENRESFKGNVETTNKVPSSQEKSEEFSLNIEKTNPIILALTKQLLKNLQIPDYQNLLATVPIKEIIVSLLAMQTSGNYTIKEIADFMRISEKEVINITKKMLLLYRENINIYFDSLVKKLDAIDTSEKILIKQTSEVDN